MFATTDRPIVVFAGAQIPDDEIRLAEEKFAESLHLAQMSMHNLLENDVSLTSRGLCDVVAPVISMQIGPRISESY